MSQSPPARDPNTTPKGTDIHVECPAELPGGWQPLVRVPDDLIDTGSEGAIAAMMDLNNITREEAIKRLGEYGARGECWVNDLYQVWLLHLDASSCQITILSWSGAAILRDWRHFQTIKNQLVGEECEALELYPAESRLVDRSNQYHLWCCKDPTFRFNIGFGSRDVDYDDRRQRRL